MSMSSANTVIHVVRHPPFVTQRGSRLDIFVPGEVDDGSEMKGRIDERPQYFNYIDTGLHI